MSNKTLPHGSLGDLPWRAYFALVTFKHIFFSLKCHYLRKFGLIILQLQNVAKFHFFTVNNMVLSQFPKDRYAPQNNLILGHTPHSLQIVTMTIEDSFQVNLTFYVKSSHEADQLKSKSSNRNSHCQVKLRSAKSSRNATFDLASMTWLQ